MRIEALGLAVLLGGGCMTGPGSGATDNAIHAELRDGQGRSVGRGEVREDDGGLRVTLRTTGLRSGPHGVHLHTVGRCDPPGFESAGGHWNPGQREHGAENPRGAHRGDLPNLEVGRGGRGRLEFRIEGGALRGAGGLLDEDGAALVVHAAADDYRTDPSGNSGARIACGVLR